MEEENKNFNDKPDYIYVPKRRERERERERHNPPKDPDVWDPPSPREERGNVYLSFIF